MGNPNDTAMNPNNGDLDGNILWTYCTKTLLYTPFGFFSSKNLLERKECILTVSALLLNDEKYWLPDGSQGGRSRWTEDFRYFSITFSPLGFDQEKCIND